MKPRVLIFDNNEIIRLTLQEILTIGGYEVFAFSNPGLCPLSQSCWHKSMFSECPCSDFIISDLYMPTIDGLKLIKEQIDGGCQVQFRALMSADWSDVEWDFAEKIGCRLFSKPFDLNELLEWLDLSCKHIHPERKLVDLFEEKCGSLCSACS